MPGSEDHNAAMMAEQAAALTRRAMLQSARVAHLARRSLDYGVRTGSVSVDLHRVRRHAHLATHSTGAAIVPGGRSTRHGGGTPDVGDVPWLDEVSALQLDSPPAHLVVVGGTVAALEIAQLYRRFGSRVSVLEPAAQLLPDEDRDVSAALAEALRQDGVAVFLEARAGVAQRTDEGCIAVHVHSPAGERVVQASHLLLVRQALRHGDYEWERTNAQSHGHKSAGDMARDGMARDRLLPDEVPSEKVMREDRLRDGVRDEGVRCSWLFTDPPLALLGISERAALRSRLPLNVAKVQQGGPMPRFAKVLSDARDGAIVGAAILGTEAAGMTAMLQMAMIGRMSCHDLARGLSAHPTLAPLFGGLVAALETAGKQAHRDDDQRGMEREMQEREMQPGMQHDMATQGVEHGRRDADLPHPEKEYNK